MDVAEVTIGRPVSVDVTANDKHAPGTDLRVTSIIGSHWGSAKVDGGKFVTFTPATKAPGYGEVVYQVSDGTRSAVGIFYLTVKGNQPPVLEGSSIPVLPGQRVAVSLTAHLVSGRSATGNNHFEVLSRQLAPGISAVLSGDTLAVSATTDAIGRTGAVVHTRHQRTALVARGLVPDHGRATTGAARRELHRRALQAGFARAHDRRARARDRSDRKGPAHRDRVRHRARRLGAVGSGCRRQAPLLPERDVHGHHADLRDGGRRDRQTRVVRSSRRSRSRSTDRRPLPQSRPSSPRAPTRRRTRRSSHSTGRPARRCPGVPRSTTTRSTGRAVTASTRPALSSGPRCGFAGLSFAHSYAFRVRAVDVYREAGDWGPASAAKRYDVAPPAVSSATAQFDLTSSTSIDSRGRRRPRMPAARSGSTTSTSAPRCASACRHRARARRSTGSSRGSRTSSRSRPATRPTSDPTG